MEVRLLGPLEIAVDGEIVDVTAPKERATVSLLALRPNRPVSLAELERALWGDAPPRSAQKAIQVYIAGLRRALPGGVVVTSPAGYELRLAPDNVDCQNFERLLHKGRTLLGQRRYADSADVLESALRLWRGEPFVDLLSQPSWVAEANHLTELRASAMESLFECRLALGQHKEVCAELETAVAEYPYRERLWSFLLLALYRSGRQADALGVYQRYKRLLDDELGLTPGLDLQNLEKAILNQSSSLDLDVTARATDFDAATRSEPRPLPARMRAVIRGPTFLGRDAELTVCRAAWDEALNSGARLLLIKGAAGVGKTRLVAEFAARLSAAGVDVCFAGCDGEALTAYQPIVELLRDLGPTCAQVARMLEGPAHGESSDASGASRLDMFEKACSVLAERANQRPVLVCLDDLQWADEGTLVLLRHMLRRLPVCPMLFLATYRTGAVAAESAFDAFFDSSLASGMAQDLPLVGLPVESSTQLLQQVASRSLSDIWMREACEISEGNPFLLKELARHTPTLAFMTAVTSDQADEPFQVTPPVRRLLMSRVSRHSDEAQLSLRYAAVIGQEFDLDLLDAVMERAADAEIDEARQSGLVRRLPTGGSYCFAHALIREAIYQDMTPAERRSHHRRIATALEGRQGPSQTLDFAHHLLSSEPNQQDAGHAADAAQAAGDLCFNAAGFEQAARWYRQGIALLSRAVPYRPGDVCRMELRLGRALLAAGSWTESQAHFRSAAERASSVGLTDILPEAALGFGGQWQPFGQVDPTLAWLLHAALQETPASSASLRARLLARQALSELHSRGDEASRPLAQEALSLAEQSGDPKALCNALVPYAQVNWATLHPRERLELAGRAHEIATRHNLRDEAQIARATVITCQLERGRVDAATSVLKTYETEAEKGRPLDRWWAQVIKSSLLVATGFTQEAEAVAESALELGQSFAQQDAISVYSAQLYMVRWMQGRLPELEGVVADVVQQSPEFPAWRAAWALCMTAKGDLSSARREVTTLMACLDDIRRDRQWLMTMALISQAAWESAFEPAAPVLVEKLAGFAGRVVVAGGAFLALGPVDRWLSQMYALAGDQDGAAGYLATARRVCELAGARGWEQQIERDLHLTKT